MLPSCGFSVPHFSDLLISTDDFIRWIKISKWKTKSSTDDNQIDSSALHTDCSLQPNSTHMIGQYYSDYNEQQQKPENLQ